MLLLALACTPPKDGDTAQGVMDTEVDSAPDTDESDTDGADTDGADTDETDTDEPDSSETDTGPTDADADGYAGDGGDDCDDTDPAIHPGAEEVCEDGVDNDCDGADMTCRLTGAYPLAAADTLIRGTTLSDQLGFDGVVQDHTGDGHEDVALTSFHTLFVFPGPLPPGEWPDMATDIRITGFSEVWKLAGGDADGDGQADLAVGQPTFDEGSVWLFRGPFTSGMDLTDVGATIQGERLGGAAGIGIAFGDVDGDTVDDLVIGDEVGPRRGNDDLGAAYVFLDAPRGPVPVTSADILLVGGTDLSQTGAVVRAGVDVSGDGVGDLLVGAPGFHTSRAEGGALYVCTDLALGTTDVADCTGTLRGDTGDGVGGDLDFAGDLDGDGLADLVVGAGLPTYQGTVALLYSPIVDTVWLKDADAMFMGANDEDLGNGEVLGLGDVDGDGFDDVAFAGPREEHWAGGAGVVHVAYGPFAGVLSASDTGLVLYNEGGGNSLRSCNLGVGDPSGDGLLDLLVTGPDTEPDESGVAWVLSLDPG